MASTNYYHKNGGDFKATAGEIKAVEKALADPEFRRLVAEYAAEISDPENVAVYEAEVAAVERERGFEVSRIDVKTITTGADFDLLACQSFSGALNLLILLEKWVKLIDKIKRWTKIAPFILFCKKTNP